MKRLTAVAFFSLVACSQNKPTKVEGIDLEVLKRTEAQLQTLQIKYQAEASPIVKEHDDIVQKYCAQAGLTVGAGGDCVVNSQSGAITKKVSAAPTPTK